MFSLNLNFVYSMDNKDNYLILYKYIADYLAFIMQFSEPGLVKYLWSN